MRLSALLLLFCSYGGFILTAGTTARGQDAAPASQEESGSLSVEGTLARVDLEKKLLWLETAEGTETQIAYTEETEIIGADAAPEGLAKRTSNRIRILYQILGGLNVALKIEVLPMEAAMPPPGGARLQSASA